MALGGDVRAAAARRPAGRRRGPVGARLHRRHDRQAQGRDEHLPRQRHDDADHAGGVAVARRGPPPHLHAAQPRRRRRSSSRCCCTAASMVVLPAFDAGAVLEAIERHRITTIDARAVDALRPARPPALRRDRPVEPADRLLRRVGRCRRPGCKRRSGSSGRSSSSSTARPSAPHDRSCVLRKEEHDLDDLDRLRLVRAAGAVGPGRAARRRRQRGAAGRARRDLRPRPARDEGLLEQARGDRRGVRRRLAAHRRRAREDERRLPHDRRPQEGHDRLRRLQRLPPRDRGRDRHAPVRSPRWR